MNTGIRPRIGVTGPDKGGLTAWLMTALAVHRAGGKAVRITPGRDIDEDKLAAVVIGGGTDVDPFLYGEEPQEDTANSASSVIDWIVGLLLTAARALLARHQHNDQNYDPERDQMEKRFIRHALYTEKPLLGICRGAQLLNVTLGGSLHQRIDHFYSETTGNPRSILPRKNVTLAEGSRLEHILGSQCQVNALHEQSIRELGDGLSVSAQEGNGVIQGIERSDDPFVIGVQWHPEYLPQYPLQQRLFRQLVNAARGQNG